MKSIVCAALLAFGLSASGQSGGSAPATETKGSVYDVVSVKPSQPNCAGMSISNSPGRFSARCITVWGLLYNAYTVKSMQEHPPGLPGWADSATFDVEAKMSEDSVAAERNLPPKERGEAGNERLRALLADRFKLRVHYESRMQSIDELVIAKGGSKLKQWTTGENSGGISWGRNQIRGQGVEMERLVFCLTDVLGRTVVDKTGLSGKFDIDLKWTPDDQQGNPNAGPTFVAALGELGLKLESGKGPVNTLIVDSVEKPSEN